MNSALLYLAYLPNVFWFRNFLKYETVFIEREEKFVKASFRNRSVIAGPQGILILSIPIIGGRDHPQFYKEVKLAYHYNWPRKHWQSILSAYGSTPFFDHYEHHFEDFFEKQYEHLFDFNRDLLQLLLPLLKIDKGFAFTSAYEKQPQAITDLRSVRFADEQLEMPRYYQVFENRNGFIANLSILDLLFHLGPKTKDYLLALK